MIEIYHNIMRVEEDFLRNNDRIDLSIREMHLIEYVGEDKQNGKNISEIADYLNVARPSVTVAVNKLEKRGYLEKRSCQSDGRVVRVFLTKAGRKVNMYHHIYHMDMIREIEKGFTEQEQELLIRTIEKLNEFFKGSLGEEK